MILELLKDTGLTPKKKSNTHGGEFSSSCPACGGRDRFLCWPAQGEHGTWYCRHCAKGGDAIEFLRAFQGLSFPEACKRLGVSYEYKRRPLAVPKSKKQETFVPKKYSYPPTDWQGKAAELVSYAHKQLMNNSAELVRLAARGLPQEAVKLFRLGWLPGESNQKSGQVRDCYFRARSAWGLPQEKGSNGKDKKLWIPRGLVIPALGPSGEISRLRIRRPDEDRERFLPEMKFAVIPGSFMGPLLLAPPSGANAFVVQESELDGMACFFAAARDGLPVGALAVGTNLGKPDAAAQAMLEQSSAILVALDFDPPDANGHRPGAQGFKWWRSQYRQAVRWPSAIGKDVGEGVSLGMDIAAWLRAGLPPIFKHSAVSGAAAADYPSAVDNKIMAVENSVSSLPSPVAPEKKKQPAGMHQEEWQASRWPKAGGQTEPAQAVLPAGCPYSVDSLRQTFASKEVNDDLLIPCPEIKGQNPWCWLYYKYCRVCAGHPRCLVDFVTSPQMLAPLEKEEQLTPDPGPLG